MLVQALFTANPWPEPVIIWFTTKTFTTRHECVDDNGQYATKFLLLTHAYISPKANHTLHWRHEPDVVRVTVFQINGNSSVPNLSRITTKKHRNAQLLAF